MTIKKTEDFQSLGHYIFHNLDGKFRDKILFIDTTSGREWSGYQLKEKILGVATALKDLYDFKQGTAVCICYNHSDLTLILALAVISLGGTVASAYSKDPYAELLYLARKVEPKFLFCPAKNLNWAKQLETDMGYPVVGIVMEELTESCDGKLSGDELNNNKNTNHGGNKNHFHHLYNYQHKSRASEEGLDHQIPRACKSLNTDVCLIVMSSGTTGKPKAIPVTHAMCLNESLDLEQKHAGKENIRTNFACTASLDYVSGRLILLGSIASGYTSIIIDGFEPKSYLELIEKYRINVVYLGAASFYNFITHQDIDQYDISSLKAIFPMGAKIIYHDELAKFFAKHPHIIKVTQGYGTSESAGCAIKAMTPQEYLKNTDCCGELFPGFEAKLVDLETGRQVIKEPYKQGMLHMKGYTLFPGYYDIERVRRGESSSPFVTDETVFDDDGFYITGDIAYFNEDEELFIVGRRKETMNCRGSRKVLPQELEEVIERHEAVSKVCVLGIANQIELTLHCPRAYVVPRFDHDLEKFLHIDKTNGNAAPECCDKNKEAAGNEDQEEELKFRGTNMLCKQLTDEDNKRRALMIDIMKFVDANVAWEKQLTGGLVLLDDMPTLRETGKVNKSYLRSLTLDQIEIYGDRSSSSTSSSSGE